jgi:hypothetical protein
MYCPGWEHSKDAAIQFLDINPFNPEPLFQFVKSRPGIAGARKHIERSVAVLGPRMD